MDSVPVVAITANVGVPLLGKDSFQEIDIAGVTMPITKHSFIVKNVDDLADTIRRAFKIAQTGRPGPVLVDITKDVTANKAMYEPKAKTEIAPKVDTIRNEDIDKAVQMIKEAKKPFILVGGGAIMSGCYKEVRKLVEKMNAPVCDTLMGKGAIEGTNPLYTGMIGMHGTKTSNFGVTQCDLLVVIGARFSDRVTGNAKKFARDAKILHIDIDAAEINKNVRADASVIGDAKEILIRLNDKLDQMDHSEWIQTINELMEKYPLAYDKSRLSGPQIIEKVYELTEGDAIISTEVGQHQMWAAQFYKYKEPRQLLTSGGLGTMGYGLGASLGAKIARKDKVVVNIAGDGCFRMNMNEIATAARYNIPIIQVVINNHVLGMVRQWQTLFYNERYSNTILNDNVNFEMLAKAMGAEGKTVTTIEEFEAAFKEALELGRPVVIDCQIDKDDKVWPMVPAGAAISEAFSGEDLRNKK